LLHGSSGNKYISFSEKLYLTPEFRTWDESFEPAETAVQLASMLVLWFTTGLVRRRPKPSNQ
jgi:hypothetical protein